MNAAEYDVMARAAEQHWWYLGLRDVIARSLSGSRCRLPAGARVLDAGCGTGENLRLMADHFAPSYLAGFDLSDQALDFARRKVPAAEIRRANICDPQLPRSGAFDLVTSLDVLCIPGLTSASRGVSQLVQAIRPGGYFLVNLPAYRWLFSEHDIAVHTSQRFTAREVRQWLIELGLHVRILSYRLCFLFPAVAFSRLRHKPDRTLTPSAARSDLHRPISPALNQRLFAMLRMENALIARGIFLPFGGSVFAIAQKPPKFSEPPATL